MATIYVSKTEGSDGNDGTTKRQPVATLPYAFQLAAGTNNTIEVIDNGVYHPSGTGSPWLPGDNGSGQRWSGLTFKAGEGAKPVLCGLRNNKSGSNSGGPGDAIKYEDGWTISGFEIREFSDAAAVPNTSYDSTLIFKDNVVHHMSSRNTGGSTSGVIDYSHDTGNAETNIVENCVFFEIGKYVIGGTCTEPVHIKNCLIASYGGTSGNNNAIKLNSTGSIVEHCIITDYQGGSTVIAVDLLTRGQVKHCIFNKIETGMNVVSAISAQSNAFAEISGVTSGSFINTADSAEHDQIYTANLTWNSASFDSISPESIGQFLNYNGTQPYSYTSISSDGVSQASGSVLERDLADSKFLKSHGRDNRSRLSSAAEEKPSIGCYEFYRDFVPTDKVTSSRISNDFTINNRGTEQLTNEFRKRYDDQGTNPPPPPPFSKAVKGPAGLRKIGSKIPYKITKG